MATMGGKKDTLNDGRLAKHCILHFTNLKKVTSKYYKIKNNKQANRMKSQYFI